MDRWFTVTEIDADTYAISEMQHPEETHAYLMCGERRAALIDTGMGIGRMENVVRALTLLPVTVLTTHAHWDHTGGHGAFDDIAVHESEIAWVSGQFLLPISAVRRYIAAQPDALPKGFDPAQYTVYAGGAGRHLRNGDSINLGGRSIEVLHTPGHSPGHCCFYEQARRTLYTGDLVYRGQLDVYYPTTDPALFLHSLRRIAKLPVERVCPGHHSLDVEPDLIGRVLHAAEHIDSQGRLCHGSGVFACGDFSIRL